MFDVGIAPLLLMAFGLGVTHALDADHIVAVSSLASTRPKQRVSLQYSLRWAIGHGLTLGPIGFVVIGLGYSLPTTWGLYAERLVGIMLIVLGGYLLWDMARQGIHFHAHDGLPSHAHWHSHRKARNHQHQHGALLVGMVHGAAGSAALLALLPLARATSLAWAGVYLFLFSLGVLFAMLLFGGLLGLLFQHFKRYVNLLYATRVLIGVASVSLGVYWWHGTF